MPLGPFTKQEHLEIATLGLQLAVSQTLGVLAGWWLDRHFSSRFCRRDVHGGYGCAQGAGRSRGKFE